MYQTINEAIKVIGVYQNNHFIPRKFQWHKTDYQIEVITLTSDARDGTIKKRFYSVISKGALYRLEFNRETESWILEQVWVE